MHQEGAIMVVLAEGLVKRFGGSTDTRPIEPVQKTHGFFCCVVIRRWHSKYVVCRRMLLAQLRIYLNIGVIGT